MHVFWHLLWVWENESIREWVHACVFSLSLSLSFSFLLFSCFPPCYLFLAFFHSCLLHFSSLVPSISISSPFLSLTKASHVWVNPFICITLSLYLSNHLHFSPSIQHLGSDDTPRPSIKTFLWCWFTFGSHVPRSYACCRIIYLQTPQFGLAILNLCRDFLPVYLGINRNEKQPRTYTLPSFSAYVPGVCVCLRVCLCVYMSLWVCMCVPHRERVWVRMLVHWNSLKLSWFLSYRTVRVQEVNIQRHLQLSWQ